MKLPSATATARLTTLRSSRTLPGQPCAWSAAAAPALKPAGSRPEARAASAANSYARGRTSRRRSRNGGTVSVIASSR